MRAQCFQTERFLRASARGCGTFELVSADARQVLQPQRQRPDEQTVGEGQVAVRLRHERTVLGRLLRQVPPRPPRVPDGQPFARAARDQHQYAQQVRVEIVREERNRISIATCLSVSQRF